MPWEITPRRSNITKRRRRPIPNIGGLTRPWALASTKGGQKDQALKDFNQSLAIHPDNPGLKSFVDQITPHAAPQPPTPSNNTQPFQPSPVSFAPEGNALPKQGRFIFNAGFAADIGGYGDFQDYYGGNLNLNGAVPVAVELDLGLDYTIVPQFQMGINFNGIYRHTEPVSITSNIYPTFGKMTPGRNSASARRST